MGKRTACIGDALYAINPEFKFTYDGDDYDTLKIISDHEKPTKEAIESAKVKAQKEIDDTYYKVQRIEEYPPIGDQLDALYHAGVFPKEMADKLKAVKDKYKKPE
tara:strand:- start:154 stop:468 length:315 start_codon:yes stop_codon:yes gene_type:complete